MFTLEYTCRAHFLIGDLCYSSNLVDRNFSIPGLLDATIYTIYQTDESMWPFFQCDDVMTSWIDAPIIAMDVAVYMGKEDFIFLTHYLEAKKPYMIYANDIEIMAVIDDPANFFILGCVLDGQRHL